MSKSKIRNLWYLIPGCFTDAFSHHVWVTDTCKWSRWTFHLKQRDFTHYWNEMFIFSLDKHNYILHSVFCLAISVCFTGWIPNQLCSWFSCYHLREVQCHNLFEITSVFRLCDIVIASWLPCTKKTPGRHISMHLPKNDPVATSHFNLPVEKHTWNLNGRQHPASGVHTLPLKCHLLYKCYIRGEMSVYSYHYHAPINLTNEDKSSISLLPSIQIHKEMINIINF